MKECTPPERIPGFKTILNESGLNDDTPTAPEACKTDLKNPEKTQCQNFTTWTQYTASIDGALGLSAQIVDQKMSDKKVAYKIVMAIKTVYDGVAGVNKQFLDAIKDINAGTPYDPIPGPDPIPPFPQPKSEDDVEQAIEEGWEMLKPWLEKFIAKIPSGSPWIKVLEGIIQSSETMIDDLKKLFDGAKT
jgi:hypothetical protein